jgi:hypothetical protein
VLVGKITMRGIEVVATGIGKGSGVRFELKTFSGDDTDTDAVLSISLSTLLM